MLYFRNMIYSNETYTKYDIPFQEAPNLPKTRSGKIMRRVLRKIAKNDPDIGN